MHSNCTPFINRYYLNGGSYERDRLPNGDWRNLTYISTPAGLSAVLIQNENTQEADFYFLHTDYQGTILAIADYQGDIVEEYSYDPWGNRREVSSWANVYTNTNNPSYGGAGGGTGILYRGYTAHEHLDCFALINMNGRMYDPVLGRMLSADNFMHSGTQGLNRYSYVFNNPLKFTDPDGENPLIYLAASMLFGGLSQALATSEPGMFNWSGFAKGAISTGLSTGLNMLFPVVGIGIIRGAVFGGTISGLTNAIMTSDGTSFFKSFGQGFLGGAVSGGIAGYSLAKAGGRNYWWGFKPRYNRTQWDISFTHKPDVYHKSGQKELGTIANTCVPTAVANALSELGALNASYQEIFDLVYKTWIEYYGGVGNETVLYELFYEFTDRKGHGTHSYFLPELEEAILSYVKDPNAAFIIDMPGANHTTNIQTIEHVPGKYFRLRTFELNPAGSNQWIKWRINKQLKFDQWLLIGGF